MTRVPKKLRSRRTHLVEPDFGIAVERAVMALDASRGGDPAELHHNVKVLRAMITASELEDEERTWS